MGKPKQLLPYRGATLLQYSLQVAIDTGLRPIVTVLGANAGLLKEAINSEAVTMVMNKDWEEGMASSIRCGLETLLEINPDLKAVIIMVCDQPFVTTKLLNDLLENYQQINKPMVASKYGNSVGTPALFDTTIFASLLALQGDRGAKKLIMENPDWLSLVDFPLGDFDIDTQDDYEALVASPGPSEGGE